MNKYALVRKDQGIKVERHKDYKYKALAYSFVDRKVEPFIVTVTPESNKEISLNMHKDQEFNYILQGKLKLYLGNKEIILNEGDSIYFDSSIPHGMIAPDNQICKFLAIIIS